MKPLAILLAYELKYQLQQMGPKTTVLCAAGSFGFGEILRGGVLSHSWWGGGIAIWIFAVFWLWLKIGRLLKRRRSRITPYQHPLVAGKEES